MVDTLRAGDYFVSSGEVLFRNWNIEGTGAKRTYAAEAEWTFPPEFAELVWSDGNTVDRQIIDMKGMAPFSSHKFRVPSTRPERNGCGSRCGIRRGTAHSRSLFTSSKVARAFLPVWFYAGSARWARASRRYQLPPARLTAGCTDVGRSQRFDDALQRGSDRMQPEFHGSLDCQRIAGRNSPVALERSPQFAEEPQDAGIA